MNKVLVKINLIPKIKCCFFGTFEGELNGNILKSFKTNNELIIHFTDKKINYLFATGKIFTGLFFFILSLYDITILLNFKATMFFLIFWSFVIFIIVFFKNLDEDIINFISFLLQSFLIWKMFFHYGNFIDILTISVFFYIGSLFFCKGLKESLYEKNFLFAYDETKNFILKIKQIKE